MDKRKKIVFVEIFVFPTLDLYFLVYVLFGAYSQTSKQKFNSVVQVFLT